MTLRALTRASTLVALTAAALVTAAASASAHVTVHSDQAVAGATDAAITFRVPNEEAKAQTTKIQVIFPTDHPLIGVLIKDHPGWSADVQTAKLPTPVTTDDGPVSDAVSPGHLDRRCHHWGQLRRLRDQRRASPQRRHRPDVQGDPDL